MLVSGSQLLNVFCMYKAVGGRQQVATVEVAHSSDVDVIATGHITLVMILFPTNEPD